jgi:hypothetical protein
VKARALRALLALGLTSAVPACIEVGHEAEIGCFVDPAEPGCPKGPDASLPLRDAASEGSAPTPVVDASVDGDASSD